MAQLLQNHFPNSTAEIHTYKGYALAEDTKPFSIQEEIAAVQDFLLQCHKHKQKKEDLVLIGHSLGCYLAKEALQKKKIPIKYFFCIFPFWKREQGSAFQNRIKSALNNSLLSEVVLKSHGFFKQKPFVENFLRHFVFKHAMNQKSIEITNRYFLEADHIVKNLFFLAQTEFDEIPFELDKDFLVEFKSQLRIYFTNNDEWAPTTQLEELKELDSKLYCDYIANVGHDFCVRDFGNSKLFEKISLGM